MGWDVGCFCRRDDPKAILGMRNARTKADGR
jgi:hypothetical protein